MKGVAADAAGGAAAAGEEEETRKMATALVFCKKGDTMKELAKFLASDQSTSTAGGWEDAFGELKTKTYAGQKLDHWVDVIRSAEAAGEWHERWKLNAAGRVEPSKMSGEFYLFYSTADILCESC